jgi:hypothetical protein
LQETLARYPLSEIYRWAYKPGVNFYFEIKAEGDDAENPVYTFTTAEVCVEASRGNMFCSFKCLALNAHS